MCVRHALQQRQLLYSAHRSLLFSVVVHFVLLALMMASIPRHNAATKQFGHRASPKTGGRPGRRCSPLVQTNECQYPATDTQSCRHTSSWKMADVAMTILLSVACQIGLLRCRTRYQRWALVLEWYYALGQRRGRKGAGVSPIPGVFVSSTAADVGLRGRRVRTRPQKVDVSFCNRCGLFRLYMLNFRCKGWVVRRSLSHNLYTWSLGPCLWSLVPGIPLDGLTTYCECVLGGCFDIFVSKLTCVLVSYPSQDCDHGLQQTAALFGWFCDLRDRFGSRFTSCGSSTRELS